MEDWQLDFEWLRIRHFVKESLQRQTLPDVNGVLFLIGIQELGRWPDKFTKEEKQDLMHLAVCRLLEEDGYYTFIGRDEDGWPHYEELQAVPIKGVKPQETLLKEKMVAYFRPYLKEQATPPQNEHD